MKSFECAAAKKKSFIRKNITLFPMPPPPFYRRRRSLHLKNFEHIWSTKYWRPQSRRLNTSLSLSLSIFGKN